MKKTLVQLKVVKLLSSECQWLHLQSRIHTTHIRLLLLLLLIPKSAAIRDHIPGAPKQIGPPPLQMLNRPHALLMLAYTATYAMRLHITQHWLCSTSNCAIEMSDTFYQGSCFQPLLIQRDIMPPGWNSCCTCGNVLSLRSWQWHHTTDCTVHIGRCVVPRCTTNHEPHDCVVSSHYGYVISYAIHNRIAARETCKSDLKILLPSWACLALRKDDKGEIR